ncbi:MAG: M23 family metallopeptidase [Proteobacteria bacterium]|nr:M23 family metallopeptidase [Pseudomonadota bacterium]
MLRSTKVWKRFLAGSCFLSVLLSCTTSRSRHSVESPSPQEVFQNDKIVFLWPVKNPRVLNFYGWRGKRRMHDGIDIKAQTGDPILASETGRVVHADWIRGYGRCVILSHGNAWYSLYAHLSKIKVKQGFIVPQQAVVGLAGRSGNASGTHLHFEIRKNADPLDPMLFLPKEMP